ncbi:MAG: hypothetical protein IJ455_06455 [Agathobacter sp.]|nr:hypothetical protein [Agathobacter sp.]
MMKQAWRSYIASLHPRNIKKLRESAAYAWIYILMLFMYAIIALLQDNGYADFVCLAAIRMFLPLGLMGWSNLGSKYLMPKAMFLCPMKEKERREYVNCVLVIKIGMMVLASLCVELVWSIFFGFRLLEVLLVPFHFLLIGLAEYAGYEVKRDERGQIPTVAKDKRGNRVPIWMNSMVAVCALLFIAFITSYDMDVLKYGREMSREIMFTFAGVAMTFAILFAYKTVKGQYRYVIEQSSDYELHFNVKGKVESPKKYDLFAK